MTIKMYVKHDRLSPDNVRLTREIPDNTPVKVGDPVDHEGAGYTNTPWVITAIEDVVVVNDGRPVCPYTAITVRASDQPTFVRAHGVQYGDGNVQYNNF